MSGCWCSRYALAVVLTATFYFGGVCGGVSGEFQPIRIKIDTSLLFGPDVGSSKSRICSHVGATYYDMQEQAVTCTGDDLRNSTTVGTTLSAFTNAANRLSTMLLVNPQSSKDLAYTLNCANEFIPTPVLNADHVVFVTMRPTDQSKLVAGTLVLGLCNFSTVDGRPISSAINVQPRDSSDPHLLTTVTRLLMQVLGFDYDAVNRYLAVYDTSTNTTKTYKNYDSVKYPYGPLDVSDATGSQTVSPVRDAKGNIAAVINASLVTATQRLRLITPKVVAAAQQHFNCPQMNGVLLEEMNSALMRWERRQLNLELLTGEYFTTTAPLLTKFTVAAFEDMGFYRIHSTFVPDPYVWGASRGCAFVQSCTDASWGTTMCNVTSGFGIGYDGTFFGSCPGGNYGEVLAEVYRHYPASPKLGGIDTFADYCPYVNPSPSDDKVVALSCVSVASPASSGVNPSYSNRTCPYCSAFFTSVLNQSMRAADRSPMSQAPKCMEAVCLSSSSMMVRIGDIFFRCNKSTTYLELTFPPSAEPSAVSPPINADAAIRDYTFFGQVVCPDPITQCSRPEGFRSASPAAVLNESTWPVLTRVSPLAASVAGGERLTVNGRNLRSHIGNPLPTQCRGLLIGGQPTDFTTFVYVGYNAATDEDTFTVNTSSLPGIDVIGWDTQVALSSLIGGGNSDGSGVVDVVLLCAIDGVLSCTTGDKMGYGSSGMCGVSAIRNVFTLTPIPPPPPVEWFLSSTTNQIWFGSVFAVVYSLMVYGSVKYLQFCNRPLTPEEIAYYTACGALEDDDDDESDIDLEKGGAAVNKEAAGGVGENIADILNGTNTPEGSLDDLMSAMDEEMTEVKAERKEVNDVDL